MPSVSVVRVGPTREEEVLRNALIDYFEKSGKIDANDATDDSKSATTTTTSTRGKEQQILVSNKYFSAKVAFQDIDSKATNGGGGLDNTDDVKEDGIILAFDSQQKNNFDSLDPIHASAERAGAGDLLRLCVGLKMGQPEEATDDKEYSRRVMWCLDRGYEYCEADLSPEGIMRGHDERDKEGFARIVEAICGTVWSSAVMAATKKKELKDEYAETKASANQQKNKQEENEPTLEPPEEDLPIYEPPDPSLLQMPEATVGASDADDERRESRARDAILQQSGMDDDKLLELTAAGEEKEEENVDPAADTSDNEEQRRRRREELEQERAFNDMEGAIRQARSIREMSRSGTMTDDERRKRAGDAALLLMDLMGKTFPSEDSDNEGEEEQQA